MNLNKYIWKKMDALFMDWQQFESLLDRRLTELLHRSVHPKSFVDNGYCEFSTDALTSSEILHLLKACNADDKDAEDHKPYESSKEIRFITAEFAVKLLQPELLFPVDKVSATKDGIYLFNKAISFVKDYEMSKNNKR